MLDRTRTASRAVAFTNVPRSSAAANRETFVDPATWGRAPCGSLKQPRKCSLKSRRKPAVPRRISRIWARQCAPAPVYFPATISATGDALAFAVEFHRALADREVGGRLNLLYDCRRLGICPQLAVFRRGLVHVREDHRGRLEQLVDGVRAGLEHTRVRPEVDDGQVRLVQIVDNDLHVAEDGRVARQVRDEPVGELHNEADWWTVPELGAISFQQVLLGLREQ